MTPVTRSRWCTAYTTAVGLLDVLSGLALVLVPAQTLALAGLEPEEDLLFVSFVGAFVAAIGLVYLWAAWSWARWRNVVALRTVWGATAMVRLVIGGFVVTHVVLDSFEPIWLWVGVADLVCAAVQFTGFHAGWIASDETR